MYNPWVIKKANENNVFRAQVVELGLNWVQQEQNCKLESKWKVIKSKYKGGGGENGWDVVPFPVDESMLDPKDREAIKKEEEEKRKRIPGSRMRRLRRARGGARVPFVPLRNEPLHLLIGDQSTNSGALSVDLDLMVQLEKAV